MKKCFVLILSLVLITACKNTTTDSTNSTDTNTQPKPTTLADRSGTYKGISSSTSTIITIVINKDGTGSLKAGSNSEAVNCTIGNPESISTSFAFKGTFNPNIPDTLYNFIIDFNNNTLVSEDYTDYKGYIFTITKQ